MEDWKRLALVTGKVLVLGGLSVAWWKVSSSIQTDIEESVALTLQGDEER